MTSHNPKVTEFVVRVESQGFELFLEGNWVKVKPAPPVAIIMELSEISNEVAEFLKERSK